MSKYVLKDAYIAINGTALSNLASHVDIDDSADEIDFTGFSTAGYREIGQGLKDATINCTFFSDFAAAGVNSGVNNIIQPLYSSGGTFSVEVRPTSSAVSATNPKATMTARVYAYSGIAGDVGDASTFDCAFRNAGTAGLVWGTT
jgi:hypothetical protein